MKVQVEDLSPIKKKLSIEVPETDYKKALDRAYEKLKKTVQVKGFRKGKVPRPILEKYYGAKTSMDTVSDLVDKSYREAVVQQEIKAVGMPNISDLKIEDNAPLSFIAEVEVQPQVEAKNFEKIKLKKEKASVSEEELNAELKQLQKSQAQWVPVETGTAAAEGHTVMANFEGSIEGVPFEGGKGENVPIPLGSKQFLPDFEAGFIGNSKGDKIEFEVKFPADYGVEHLKDKVATFKVEILEIKREDLPELDDEFAKDLGKFDTIDKVKSEIETRLLAGKEQAQRGELFKQILDHLIKKNAFELPEAMVERELDFMWRSVMQQLEQQKMTPEQVGINPQDYREKNREEAIRRIKGFLLFDSIASQNKLEVSEAEVEAKLAEIAQGYGQPVDVVKKFYEQQNLIRSLYSQILEEKTLDFVISKAKVSEK